MTRNNLLFTPIAILIFSLLTYLNLSSCTKTNTHTVMLYDTTVVNDTVRPAPSILSLFTGKEWEYDTVYINYTGPGSGNLDYARGDSASLEDLDSYLATWSADGYYWTSFIGDISGSPWRFLGSDSASYQVGTSAAYSLYGRILSLSAAHLTIYDSTASQLEIYEAKTKN